jgi:hypothetical protein
MTVVAGHRPISFKNHAFKIKAMKHSDNCKIGWKTRIIWLDSSYRVSMELTDLGPKAAVPNCVLT